MVVIVGIAVFVVSILCIMYASRISERKRRKQLTGRFDELGNDVESTRAMGDGSGASSTTAKKLLDSGKEGHPEVMLDATGARTISEHDSTSSISISSSDDDHDDGNDDDDDDDSELSEPERQKPSFVEKRHRKGKRMIVAFLQQVFEDDSQCGDYAAHAISLGHFAVDDLVSAVRGVPNMPEGDRELVRRFNLQPMPGWEEESPGDGLGSQAAEDTGRGRRSSGEGWSRGEEDDHSVFRASRSQSRQRSASKRRGARDVDELPGAVAAARQLRELCEAHWRAGGGEGPGRELFAGTESRYGGSQARGPSTSLARFSVSRARGPASGSIARGAARERQGSFENLVTGLADVVTGGSLARPTAGDSVFQSATKDRGSSYVRSSTERGQSRVRGPSLNRFPGERAARDGSGAGQDGATSLWGSTARGISHARRSGSSRRQQGGDDDAAVGFQGSSSRFHGKLKRHYEASRLGDTARQGAADKEKGTEAPPSLAGGLSLGIMDFTLFGGTSKNLPEQQHSLAEPKISANSLSRGRGQSMKRAPKTSAKEEIGTSAASLAASGSSSRPRGNSIRASQSQARRVEVIRHNLQAQSKNDVVHNGSNSSSSSGGLRKQSQPATPKASAKATGRVDTDDDLIKSYFGGSPFATSSLGTAL